MYCVQNKNGKEENEKKKESNDYNCIHSLIVQNDFIESIRHLFLCPKEIKKKSRNDAVGF